MIHPLITPSNVMFLSTIILSTIFMISSSNWLILWIAMELNLMAMIPLLSSHSNNVSSEAPIKYFLIQSVSSAMMILSIMLNNSTPPQPITTIVLMSALLMKMGSAPFHFWLPQVTANMNWPMVMILLTWQKVGPLAILSSMLLNWLAPLLLMLSTLNAFTGSLGGLGQTQMRPLITYSSITHTAWITATFMISPLLTFSYFILYILINLAVMAPLNLMSKSTTNKFNMSSQLLPQTSLIMLLNLMSLAGLPPFLGFIPKWMAIYSLTNTSSFIVIMLILSSLISLFYYLMVLYAAFLSPSKSMSMSDSSTSSALMVSISTLPMFFVMLMI